MGFKSKLTFISCIATTITACYSDEKPEDPVTNPDIGEPSAFQRLCENHRDSLEGRTADLGPLYPLRLTQSSGELNLENADFEDPAVAPDTFVINSDPMYIYSGEGSAQLSGESFRAHVFEDEHFSTRILESLTFWLYSANDETLEFAVTNHGMMLDRINNDDGYGYSGHSQGSEELVSIEPHSWTEVTINFELSQECLSAITIDPLNADDAVFYIDQIEISASIEAAETAGY